MKTRFRIGSYFSIATDLAAAMRDWPEFVDGSGYDVNLRSAEEEVSVRYHEDEEEPYVMIASSHVGPLFERVTGRVAYALSGHSDYLMMYRRDDSPIQPPQTTTGSSAPDRV
jgi:hypothetical protein